MTLPRMVTFILTNTRNSAQTALNKFFREINGEVKAIAKQTYFEARKKLSYTAFVQMNTDLCDLVEAEATGEDMRMFRGFRPIAVDGTVLDIPPTAVDYFGGQPKENGICPKARAVVFVDVLNDFIMRGQMDKFEKGERAITTELLGTYTPKTSDAFLFDRGFYSRALAGKIAKSGAHFVFRVKRNCQKDIDAANEEDQEICIDGLKLRVVNVLLSSGEIEKLVTNIFPKEYDTEFFYQVYGMRWGVETTYLMLKERLELEDFSSGKENLMLQDFHAAIVIYNYGSMASFDAEAKLNAEGEEKGLKYRRKPNKNLVFGELRDLLIKSFCGIVPFEKGMEQLTKAVMRNPTPIRPGRKYQRENKHPSAKFSFNRKRTR
jgi:hypothetical protein